MSAVDVGHPGAGHPHRVAPAHPDLEAELEVLAAPHPQAYGWKWNCFHRVNKKSNSCR